MKDGERTRRQILPSGEDSEEVPITLSRDQNCQIVCAIHELYSGRRYFHANVFYIRKKREREKSEVN